jgi:hypothetical protein
VNPEEREGLLEDDNDTLASRPVPPPQQTEATLLDIGGGNGSGLNMAGTALCLRSRLYIFVKDSIRAMMKNQGQNKIKLKFRLKDICFPFIISGWFSWVITALDSAYMYCFFCTFCLTRVISHIRGLTIKFANSPPCTCCGSSGHKLQYGLITLAYQCFTAMLLLIYGSLFLSGVYYYLSVFWCPVTRMSEFELEQRMDIKFFVKLGESGSEIREMLV